jgi:hypothetical protein
MLMKRCAHYSGDELVSFAWVKTQIAHKAQQIVRGFLGQSDMLYSLGPLSPAAWSLPAAMPPRSGTPVVGCGPAAGWD